MTTTIRPIGEHVLVRVLPRDEKTAGGLYVPVESVRGREDKAEVLAVSQRLTEARGGAPVRVGDVVLFDAYRVALVLGEDGLDATASAHAKGGQQAIIPANAIIGVVT